MMILTFKRYICEARKNPEQNPKVSVYDALLKYKDDPNVYISFTEIDKLGINPQSKYNTPLGIYTYPLKISWTLYDVKGSKSLKNFPFAAQHPYVWVVRAKKGEGFIDDMYRDYGSDKFDRDVIRLKQIYKNAYTAHEDNSAEEIRQSWEKLKIDALEGAKAKNPIMSFWNLTRLMAEKLQVHSKNRLSNKQGMMWNWILRQCGYTGFADKSGKGYIHPAEPTQAVFLSVDAFEVLEKVENKTYTKSIKYKISNFGDLVDTLFNLSESDQLDLVMYVGFGYGLSKDVSPKVVFTKNQGDFWEDASKADLKRFSQYISDHLSDTIRKELGSSKLYQLYDDIDAAIKDAK